MARFPYILQVIVMVSRGQIFGCFGNLPDLSSWTMLRPRGKAIITIDLCGPAEAQT